MTVLGRRIVSAARSNALLLVPMAAEANGRMGKRDLLSILRNAREPVTPAAIASIRAGTVSTFSM